jgi:hypothetical protein
LLEVYSYEGQQVPTVSDSTLLTEEHAMVYPLGQIPGEAAISTFHPEGKQLDDDGKPIQHGEQPSKGPRPGLILPGQPYGEYQPTSEKQFEGGVKIVVRGKKLLIVRLGT